MKIQGYRVELGEIEAALEKHPSLRSARVTAVGEQRGNKRLVAYVVARSGAEPAPATALRSFLREKLPEYMVPSSFVPLEALPLSSNGKVDRKALSSQLQAAAPQLRSFVAPRDATEVQLAGIWEHLLGVSPIGIHDSFFELGGNSFAAVRLVMQVQKQFAQSISLSTLLEHPTLEQLASALRSDASAAPWSSLVALQAAGSKPPFFCVHAVGGSALAYRELARRLGDDQPFYGLQAKGVDTDAPPCTDIREMARLYLEEMGRIQPRGPYHLGGWSFGGLVAFEMAQQLAAAGETVSELVLLDTQAPAPVQEQGLDEVALLHLVARDLRLPISRESLSSLTPGERLAHLNEVAIRSGLIPSGSDEPSMQRLVQVYSAHLSAAQRYTPGPYAGRLCLLRVQEPLEDRSARGDTQDPTWGWASFVQGQVTVELVPGDHFTMVWEPHVGHLAETLRRILHASPRSDFSPE